MTMKKMFRKAHLWLSIPFGIFITLICFSGAMLVFEKEITEQCRHDLYFVADASHQPLPMQELMDKVAEILPDSVAITGVTVSSEKDRAYQVSLSKPRRAAIYIDQYTGEVKGRNERLPFFDTMFRLHRWMMGTSGNNDGIAWGKMLVGVSTIILVLILITGIAIWLSNKNKPLTKSLKISFTKGWPRFWHDLHVAGGIYATIFLSACALTGLTWSFSWYRTGFYKTFGVEASASGTHASNSDRQANNDRTRNAGGRQHNQGRAAYEARDSISYRNNNGHRHRHSAERHSPYANWQAVYEHLAQSNPGYRQISISDGSAKVIPEGRISLRASDSYDFDKRSGKITGSKPYAEQDKATKIRSAVYMVHVGSWGGIITRIIVFLSALTGAALPLTGYYLWIRRLLRKGNPKHPHPTHK